jgi:hypothetical protein
MVTLIGFGRRKSKLRMDGMDSGNLFFGRWATILVHDFGVMLSLENVFSLLTEFQPD